MTRLVHVRVSRPLNSYYKSEVDLWVKYNSLSDRPVLIEWGESGEEA